MIFLGILFGSIVFFMVLVIFCIYEDNNTSIVNKKNYEVRFSPQNNKYYIVNVNKVNGTEKKVTGKFGFTIYYDNQIDVEYVVEKLNK